MPVMDEIEATRRILADQSLANVHVVALTTFDTDEFVFQALSAGGQRLPPQGRGAAEHPQRGEGRRLGGGAALLGRHPPSHPGGHVQGAAGRGTLRSLTEREQEVLAAVGEGLSNDDIGSRLFMSPATARTHVSRILTKLGARDRAQLVAIAWRAGIVEQ